MVRGFWNGKRSNSTVQQQRSSGSCPTTVDAAAANPAGVVGYVAQNPSAQYILAGSGARGTAGRSTLKLQAINDIDITLSKNLNITERFKVQFIGQAFNLFNHPQYVGGYLNDVGSVGYTGSERNMLIPTSSSFNQPQDVFSSNPRTLQLVLSSSSKRSVFVQEE